MKMSSSDLNAGENNTTNTLGVNNTSDNSQLSGLQQIDYYTSIQDSSRYGEFVIDKTEDLITQGTFTIKHDFSVYTNTMGSKPQVSVSTQHGNAVVDLTLITTDPIDDAQWKVEFRSLFFKRNPKNTNSHFEKFMAMQSEFALNGTRSYRAALHPTVIHSMMMDQSYKPSLSIRQSSAAWAALWVAAAVEGILGRTPLATARNLTIIPWNELAGRAESDNEYPRTLYVPFSGRAIAGFTMEQQFSILWRMLPMADHAVTSNLIEYANFGLQPFDTTFSVVFVDLDNSITQRGTVVVGNDIPTVLPSNFFTDNIRLFDPEDVKYAYFLLSGTCSIAYSNHVPTETPTPVNIGRNIIRLSPQLNLTECFWDMWMRLQTRNGPDAMTNQHAYQLTWMTAYRIAWIQNVMVAAGFCDSDLLSVSREVRTIMSTTSHNVLYERAMGGIAAIRLPWIPFEMLQIPVDDSAPMIDIVGEHRLLITDVKKRPRSGYVGSPNDPRLIGNARYAEGNTGAVVLLKHRGEMPFFPFWVKIGLTQQYAYVHYIDGDGLNTPFPQMYVHVGSLAFTTKSPKYLNVSSPVWM